MWTTIKKTDYDKFINEYFDLTDFQDQIVLHETDTHYILPKWFWQSYPHNTIHRIGNSKFKPKQINDIHFSYDLLPAQTPIVNSVLNIYKHYNEVHGIIQARPGTGKTVISIYLTCQLKFKTMIIVDNSKLLNQWKNEILKFTNLTEDQIGLIQGSTLKIDDDKKIVLAMVQTLVSKSKRDLRNFYNNISEAGFNLVFYDECHKTTAGEKYAKASLFLDTSNIIGLSATPFVDDIHKILLHNTIGPILVKSKEYEIIPQITFVKYNSMLSEIMNNKKYNSMKYLFTKDRLLGNAKYNSSIVESMVYFEVIRYLVTKLKAAKHKVIIIAFTKKQVESISNVLSKAGIKNIMFYSKQQKVNKKKDNVLVATYQFASHGFDYKGLSSIILACPLSGKKSLIQCIGRILRSCEGKTEAFVFDLIDTNIGKIFLQSINTKKKILSNEFNGCQFQEIEYEL